MKRQLLFLSLFVFLTGSQAQVKVIDLNGWSADRTLLPEGVDTTMCTITGDFDGDRLIDRAYALTDTSVRHPQFYLLVDFGNGVIETLGKKSVVLLGYIIPIEETRVDWWNSDIAELIYDDIEGFVFEDIPDQWKTIPAETIRNATPSENRKIPEELIAANFGLCKINVFSDVIYFYLERNYYAIFLMNDTWHIISLY